jgi:alkylation response protein AidB-like acyl-CoA dehydrogenase
MDFSLSKENEMIRKEVRKFAQAEIKPVAEALDSTGEYPYEILNKMGTLGFMGIPFPETYGGTGGDWVGMHVCIEEVSRADISVGLALDASISLVAQEIFTFGTEEQKRKWLVPLLKGDEIGAFALTEADAGSDAGAIRTTAALEGDEWVLNGTKQFISIIGMDNASIMIVAAVSGKNKGGNVISTFIVPKSAVGFKLGHRYKKLGMMSSATHEVILENCRIPQEYLLGDPDRGFAQHLTVLETGRITVAAMSVGLAQACLDEALNYAKGRRQFGRPIFEFQAVQFKLADMAVGIELARNQYLKAAWLKDQGKKHTFEATAAKLYASEMVEKVASDALQIHGGYGYMEEYPVSRYYKAAKLNQIIEGSSEVQRMIIGRILSGKN